jgi:hypothetical protein
MTWNEKEDLKLYRIKLVGHQSEFDYETDQHKAQKIRINYIF